MRLKFGLKILIQDLNEKHTDSLDGLHRLSFSQEEFRTSKKLNLKVGG